MRLDASAQRIEVPGAARRTRSAIGRGTREFLRLSLSTTAGRVGLPIVVIHILLAIVGPFIAPYSITEFHLPPDYPATDRLAGPSWTYWFGTDQFGRDVFSRVLSGGGTLITLSLAGALLGLLCGTLIGMSSGYQGGRVDQVVMRVMDGMMAFPALLLALLMLTTLGARDAPFRWLEPYWQGSLIVVTIGLVFAPSAARVMRSVSLQAKNLEFVMSARLRGESTTYIIYREILPHALPVIGVEFAVRLSYSILLVSSLGFLGLGVQPPSPDWGLMIAEGRQFIGFAPWTTLAPAGAVATLVVGVNLLTDGIKHARGMPQEIVG